MMGSTLDVVKAMSSALLETYRTVDDTGIHLRVTCRYCLRSIYDNDFYNRDGYELHNIQHKPDCVIAMALDIKEMTCR